MNARRKNGRRKFIEGVGKGLTSGILARAMPWGGALARALPLGVATLLLPRLVKASTVLDPTNPSNFKQDGSQTATPGTVLTLADNSNGDIILLFAPDPDAAAGIDVDVVATFKMVNLTPAGCDAGNRLVINDGVTRAAIASCIFQNNIPGMGLYSSGPPTDQASYPVFVPVDWDLVFVPATGHYEAAPCTVRLRRWANGDAELIEINGVAPAPRALLTAGQAPSPTRPFPTVEFGTGSPRSTNYPFGNAEATCTVEYSAFRSERVVQAVAGALSFTSFRLRDADSADRIRFRADYTLGSTSDGINPSLEPVSLKLFDMFGVQFYPAPDFNPLTGFDVQGNVGKRRWTLNDAERARTGVERLLIDENPSQRGGIAFRDIRTAVADTDFSTVKVEVTIGTGSTADKLTGTANLVEKPFGSGTWRLATEP